MAKSSERGPQAWARRTCQELRTSFGRHGLAFYPVVDSFKDDQGRVGWQACLPRHASLSVPLAGEWCLGAYWRFVTDPLTGEGMLEESSLSIMVEGWPSCFLPPGDGQRRLVSYDYDSRQSFRKHLNVYQPGVADNVHWYLPSSDIGCWEIPVLAGFIANGTWIDDLGRRGNWPES